MSPYNYTANNPIRFIDPDGMDMTDFVDKDDNLIKHVDDGSNAVFKQTGKGTNLHYEFAGFNGNERGLDMKDFDKPFLGKNEVNLGTAIEEQQNLNMENSSLKPIPNGGSTFCNFATQNVMETVSSAIRKDIAIHGDANVMADDLAQNPNYKTVDYAEAKSVASNGGLVVIGFRNLEKDDDGTYLPSHVATFSVGGNAKKGEIANIGRTNGFIHNNYAFKRADWANTKFYILK